MGLLFNYWLLNFINNDFGLKFFDTSTVEVKNSNFMAHIARIHVTESLLDLSKFAFKCLNRIFPSNIPAEILTNVNSLQGKMRLSTDTIGLKRELAEYVLAKREYPF